MPRNDPYKNCNFLVEIDGITVAGFAECTGLTSEVEIIEYREGNEDVVRKLA
jgi:phage tail-like protein